MRITVFGLASALALAAPPPDDRVKVDNDQTRVLFVTSAPGAKSGMHVHKINRVMIYLYAGRMTLTDPAGKVQTLNFKAGEALWSPAMGDHVSLNLTDRPVRIAEVELKKPAGAAAPLSALDPVKVDPKRYKVEMENEQVRVLRARYAPRDKGVLHEHSRNRVVTYLTEGNMKVTPEGGRPSTIVNKVGDVTWGTHARYIEENLSDKPFEVLVVEFK